MDFINHNELYGVYIKNISGMNSFLPVLGIIFGFFILSFILINIRHIITGNEFRGTCANNNPMLKDQIGECTVCGKKADEACKMPEVNKA